MHNIIYINNIKVYKINILHTCLVIDVTYVNICNDSIATGYTLHININIIGNVNTNKLFICYIILLL